MTDEQILRDILRREGGFVNNPDDQGKATNFGITLATLSAYRKTPCTVADVRALTVQEASDIYRKQYIAPFAAITNAPVRALLIDIGVNSGPAAAIKILQRSRGLTVDGILGPATIAAANAVTNLKPLVLARLQFYASLCKENSSQLQFLAGWINRAFEFLV